MNCCFFTLYRNTIRLMSVSSYVPSFTASALTCSSVKPVRSSSPFMVVTPVTRSPQRPH